MWWLRFVWGAFVGAWPWGARPLALDRQRYRGRMAEATWCCGSASVSLNLWPSFCGPHHFTICPRGRRGECPLSMCSSFDVGCRVRSLNLSWLPWTKVSGSPGSARMVQDILWGVSAERHTGKYHLQLQCWAFISEIKYYSSACAYQCRHTNTREEKNTPAVNFTTLFLCLCLFDILFFLFMLQPLWIKHYFNINAAQLARWKQMGSARWVIH